MNLEHAYAASLTAASAVGTGIVADTTLYWNIGGILVPAVPAIIGILAALLVRIIVITSPNKRARNLPAYNLSVTLLTVLATIIYITDHQLGPGASFWTGAGCGAIGVGLVELSRSHMIGVLQRILAATPPPSDNSDPDQGAGS